MSQNKNVLGIKYIACNMIVKIIQTSHRNTREISTRRKCNEGRYGARQERTIRTHIYIQSRPRKPFSTEPSLNILLLNSLENKFFLNLGLFLYDKLYGQIPRATGKGFKTVLSPAHAQLEKVVLRTNTTQTRSISSRQNGKLC